MSKRKKSELLRRRIEALENELKPVMSTLNKLREKRDEAISREFIAEHGITKSQVRVVADWRAWSRANSSAVREWISLPWFEWAGKIYRTEDLRPGWKPDSIAYYEHLPE